jgi:hypothetical protein
MPHEKSTTFQNKSGRWVNLDTIHGGKKVPQRVLEEWLADGHIKPLGGKTFATEPAAVKAAKKRSKSFGTNRKKKMGIKITEKKLGPKPAAGYGWSKHVKPKSKPKVKSKPKAKAKPIKRKHITKQRVPSKRSY